MGRQLRCIDQNPGPDSVCLSRQTVNRLDKAGNVRGAAHGEQCDTLSVRGEQPVHIVLVQASIACDRRSDDLRAPPPRQIVGVVLHRRGKDDVVWPQGIPEGELVDRFGGVLSEDDSRCPWIGADEARDRRMGLVVRDGAEARLEPSSPMNA